MRFADFDVGQVIDAGPYVLGEEELLGFARSYDPQWFHVDAAAAKQGRYGGLIASGWQTCAIAMRMVAETALRDSESFGSPGLEYVRWPVPVRAGDRLWLRATVLEARRSRTKQTIGILRWRWQLFREDEAEALDLVATSFFDLA